MSAALLVILLLLIGLYAFAGRRRAARRSQAAAADWSRPPHSRYPRAAAPADADGMLEFFAAAPVAEPATAMARTAVRTARPMATDGMFAAAGPSPVSRDPFASRPAPPAAVPYEVQDAGSGSPLGPASKAVAKRPSVSGAPPWEEASQPRGELPWSSPAARDQAAHGRHSAAPAGDLHEAASPAAPLPTRTGSLWDRAAHARPAEPGQPGGREDSDLRPGPDLRPVQGFQPRPEIRPAAAFQPEPDVRPAAAFQPDAYEPDPYLPSATSQFGERTGGPQGTQPGHRTPDRPGQSLTGRLNWSQEPSPESAPRDAPFPPPVQQPEGQRSANPLPVRQPRTPTPPPALSPSGSLWERAVDPKPAPADSEPGSRPIFVWNPAAGPEGFPAEPAELGPRLGDWSVLGRHQEQSPD